MFEYGYRIEDRFKLPLTALAIYTHPNRDTHFRSYQRAFLGTKHHYEFHTYVLVDQNLEELLQSNNPFAIVLATAWLGLKRKPNDSKLFSFKKELIRNLYKKGYPKAKIAALLDFIRYYVNFTNSEFSSKFEEEIDLLSQPNQPMGIQEAIKTELIKIGEAKGIEKGIEIGETSGEEKGLKFAAAQLLLKGFPPEQTAELLSLPLEKVMEVAAEIAEGNIPKSGIEEE